MLTVGRTKVCERHVIDSENKREDPEILCLVSRDLLRSLDHWVGSGANSSITTEHRYRFTLGSGIIQAETAINVIELLLKRK